MLFAAYRGEYTVYTRCMSEVGELLLEVHKERKGVGLVNHALRAAPT